MATKNMIFEAVRISTSQEISQFCKMRYADIFWDENVLIIMKKSLDRTPDSFKDVLPLVTPMTTVDGVEVYVAHKTVYIIGSNPAQYKHMCNEYHFVDGVYYDVTNLFNGKSVCIDSINWADRNQFVRVQYCKLPWLKESRWFYTQG